MLDLVQKAACLASVVYIALIGDFISIDRIEFLQNQNIARLIVHPLRNFHVNLPFFQEKASAKEEIQKKLTISSRMKWKKRHPLQKKSAIYDILVDQPMIILIMWFAGFQRLENRYFKGLKPS